MSQGGQLEFSGSGLLLTFSRDLAQKYTRYFGPDGKEPPELVPEGTWVIAGYYDLLRVRPLGALEQLKDLTEEEWRRVSWRSFRDMVLIPFAESVDEGYAAFVNQLERPATEKDMSNPLLVVIPISVSPAIFEFRGEASRTLLALRSTIDLLTEYLAGQVAPCATVSETMEGARAAFDFPMYAFASLSGADVVVLALPRTAQQLWGTNELVRHAREMELKKIQQHTRPADSPPEPDLPGHAFVSVDPILAFSHHASAHFKNGDFRTGERASGLRLSYELRVDCGHELRVSADMQRTLKQAGLASTGEDAMSTSWGTYGVQGHFDSLAQVVEVCNENWLAAKKHNHWREEHLIDSTTALSFSAASPPVGEQPLPHSGRAWQLTEAVKTGLDEIRGSLETFASKYLNDWQTEELMGIYYSFRACFFRQGLLGTARDLFPFFRQLARALSLPQWEKYLHWSGEVPGEDRGEGLRRSGDFTRQLGNLFAHAQRAVRNRVEHRSLQGDPPFPHTLSHGACKLINSYSAVFSAAARLLCGHLDQQLGQDPPPGDAESFAAAVCAGSCGRVQCDELFADFREFVQTQNRAKGTIHRPPQTGAIAPKYEGRSRLLLLDISGTSLLRPELCFVHCLHEMAELSEWIMLPRNNDLREALNRWVMEQVEADFAKALARVEVTSRRQYGAPEEDQESRSKREDAEIKVSAAAYKSFASQLVRYAAVVYGLGNGKEIDPSEIGGQLNELCQTAHPAELAEGLSLAIDEAAKELVRSLRAEPLADRALATRLTKLLQTGLPDVAWSAHEAARSQEFALATESIDALATEVLADIGMWCTLDYILGDGAMRDAAARKRDVARIFKSLLRASAESYPLLAEERRLDYTILVRWAIQASALTTHPEWIGEIVQVIEHLENEFADECKHRQAQAAKTTTGVARPQRALNTIPAEVAQAYLENRFARLREGIPSPTANLIAALARLPAYRSCDNISEHDELRRNMFPTKESLTGAEAELLEAFRWAWEPDVRTIPAASAGARDDTEPAGQGRSQPGSASVRFVFQLWATAGRFAVANMLQVVPRESTTQREVTTEPSERRTLR